MKKIYRRICTLLLILCLSISSVMVSYASPANTGKTGDPVLSVDLRYYDTLSDEELTEALMSFGISREEAVELVVLKNETPSTLLPQRVATGSFPSNPQIGDTCWIDYYLEAAYINSAADAYGLLVNLGVPAVAATVVAAAVLAYKAQNPSTTGIHVRVEYYYGPNNDGVVMWTYRRVECSGY